MGPSLQATMEKDGKLKIRILKVIRDQTIEKYHLSLFGKVQDERPNIDDVMKWAKYKWKIRGNLNIKTLPNNYLLLVLKNEEDQNAILITP